MKIFLILFAILGLAGCVDQPGPSKPVIVEIPDSDTINKNDSTYLRIAVLAKGYELSILDKYLKTDSPDSIDQFITANKNILNNQKIALQRIDSNHDRFERLLTVLKKHKIFKYSMVTTEL